MRKIWLIARREYWYNFRRRSFLFTAFGVPLFTFFMMFVVFAISNTTLTGTGQLGNIGYVDQGGVLADAVEKPEEYQAFPDLESAHAALLDGSIGAYFVLPADFLKTGVVEAYTLESVPDGIENQFTDFVQANLAHLAPPELPLERLRNPLDLTVIELGTGAELSGTDAFLGRFMSPLIFSLIFLMAVNTTSQFLMSGVVEEKESRMMEVLITSCTPLEMLWGKVLGLGALGLTQVVLWGIGGALLIQSQPESAFLQSLYLDPGYLAIGLVYLVLGYFLVASIMAGIGAVVTAEQEGRQFASVITLAAVLPYLLIMLFMQNPNDAVPVALSLFPLTAPIAMLLRIPMGPVPGWQVILSMVLLAAACLLTVWVAAQVFRIGLLMYGKRLSLREIVAAIRQGRRSMLTTSQEAG